MRFLRTLVALAVTVCVALLAVAIAGYGSSVRMGDDAPEAPAEVFEPFGWQATVAKDPPGPATVLVSGDGWGMRGPTYRGKVAVVAESGVYRMLRYKADVEAGEDVLLSPDGTLVADALPHSTPGASGSPAAATSTEPSIWITDLTNGAVSRLTVPGNGAVRPIAWSPDNRRLLVHGASSAADGPWFGGELDVLDLGTGDVRRLVDLGSEPVRRAQLAAFSPDGRRVAVQVGDALQVFDLANRTNRTLTRLGPDRRLAGVGAWSTRGDRIAVLTLSGCTRLCTTSALDDRVWQLDEVDAVSGTSLTGGFDRVTGSAVRVLGRTDDGDVVLVRYRAADDLNSDSSGTLTVDGDEVEETDYAAVEGVELLALDSSGDRRTLIDLPPGSRHVDVAADLVTNDRFDGKSSRPMPFPAPFWVNALAVVALLLVLWLVFRVRRATRG